MYWKMCVFNSHDCYVFRSLLKVKMAKKWQIGSVPTVTRSVLQKPKMVWGKSLKWQLEQHCRPRSAGRRTLAFCYRSCEEWKLHLSTCWTQPPSKFDKWETRGKDPEERKFLLPSFSQQILVAMETFCFNLTYLPSVFTSCLEYFCLK